LRILSQLELNYRYDLLDIQPWSRASVPAVDASTMSRITSNQAARWLREFDIAKIYFQLSQFGWRNYSSNKSDFYTDHWFVNLDLLTDFNLTDRIRFSVIGGSSFEYHDDKEDDIFLYLLSGNLSYQFK
jgi:hypothetical protein